MEKLVEEFGLATIKSKLVDVVVKQAMEKLLLKAPWLSFGPANWLATTLIQSAVKFLVARTILGVNLLLIELHIDGRVEEFEEILDRLKVASGEEEIDRLEKELIEASRGLIRFRDHFRMPTNRSE